MSNYKFQLCFKGVEFNVEAEYSEDRGDYWTPPSTEFFVERITAVDPAMSEFIDHFSETIQSDTAFEAECLKAISDLQGDDCDD